ncbi:MAG: HAD family hydrolase [Ruminococcaceae bacterium]|nr:HAD family hydrolase [Oscillospiraceae bacterium]
MNNIKYILLDAYGTFINTRSGSVDAAAKILAKRGSSLDAAEFYARWKAMHRSNMRTQERFIPEREMYARELEVLYGEYGIDGDAREDVAIMLASMLDRHFYPEAKEMFSRLSRRFRLVVASNTDTAPLMQNLEYNDYAFERVYTSEALGCYKPAPEFYRQILSDLGCSPREALFAGDSPEEDVIAPGSLGMTTVFVDRGNTGAQWGQTFTVTDLSGLSALL